MPRNDPAAQVEAALGVLLLRANRAHLYGRVTQAVPEVDATTYPVLSGLARTGPVTATRLAELIGLDRTVTTRHATRLEQVGLVSRTPDPEDARATRLALTPAGQRAVKLMRTALRGIFSDALAGWDNAEAEIFAHQLGRLVEAIVSTT
jgi:DNA-binding MarR family transcriptional regulator